MKIVYQLQLDEKGFCIGYVIAETKQDDCIEIDKKLYPMDSSYFGRKFDVENMQWLDEYADWYKAPPKPALSEAEQRELDRDEMLLDNLISNQQIILLLESGGDRV